MKRKFYWPLFIYFAFLILGIVLIIVASLNIDKIDKTLFTILTSVGCGLIPTAIAGFCIELVNNIQTKRKIDECREATISNFNLGIEYLVRVTIRDFLPNSIKNGTSIHNALKKSIEAMKRFEDSYDNNLFETMKERLGYGFRLCIDVSKTISSNHYLFVLNSIYSEQQIKAIGYSNIYFDEVSISSSVGEIAENLDIFFDEIFKNFNNLIGELDKTYYIKDNKIRRYIQK